MQRHKHLVRDPNVPFKVRRTFDSPIFLWLHKYEFVRSDDLADLCGRSTRAMQRRLFKLFHNGAIARFKDPTYDGYGSAPHMIGLANLGSEYLELWHGIPAKDYTRRNRTLFTRPNSTIKRLRRIRNFEHELRVPSIMAAFYRGLRGSDIDILESEDIAMQFLPVEVAREHKPFRWSVPVSHEGIQHAIGIEPDAVFAFRRNGKHMFFFLENDEGTEDTWKSDIEAVSVYQKMRAYASTYEHSIQSTRFGMNNFRVLWPVPDEHRKQAIFRMVDRHRLRAIRGFQANMHLFQTRDALARSRNYLDGWENCDGQIISLKQ